MVARSLSRGSTRTTPPAGTEVADTRRTIPRARALRRKAGVRISAVRSSLAPALSPSCSRQTSRSGATPSPRTRSSARLPGARLPRRQLNRRRPRGTPRRPLNGGAGSAWTGASNIDRERDGDQPRLGAQGSSSTVQRGGGHWSRAHSKKFWPSSSSTVRCCRPTMIQGLSGLCSVSVKPSFDTNVCSHDCQGVGALARTARSRLPGPLARSVPYAVLGRRVPLRRRYAAVGVGPPTIGHGPPQLVRSWCPSGAPRETSSAFIARPAAVSAPSW